MSDLLERINSAAKTLGSIEKKIKDIEPKLDDMITSAKIIEKNKNDINKISKNAKDIQSVASNIEKISKVSDRIDDTLKPLNSKSELYESMMKKVNDIKLSKIKADEISKAHDDLEFVIKNSSILSRVPSAQEIRAILNDLDNSKWLNDYPDHIDSMLENIRKTTNDLIENKDAIEELILKGEDIIKSMHTLNVNAEKVDADYEGELVEYEPKHNKLSFKIPKGESGEKGERGEPGSSVYKGDKGDKGDDGKDGASFAPGSFGDFIDRGRYDGFPVGFSFVALDELPVKLYFRKNNSYGSWTDGIPFGTNIERYEDIEAIVESGIDINRLIDAVAEKIKEEAK